MEKITQQQAIRLIRKVLETYSPMSDSIEGLDKLNDKVITIVNNAIEEVISLTVTKPKPKATTVIVNGERGVLTSKKSAQQQKDVQATTTVHGDKIFIKAPDNE